MVAKPKEEQVAEAAVEESAAATGTDVATTGTKEMVAAQTDSTAVVEAPKEKTFEEMMAEDAGAGSEFIGMNERTIPFLAVLQNASPQAAKGGPEYIKGAESSMFMNTLTRQIYGANIADEDKGKGIIFVPTHFKVKPIEWHKRGESGDGGGLVRIWGDDDSYKTNGEFVFDAKRNRWVNNANNSEVSDHYETYGLFVGHIDKDGELIIEPMPSVLSMKGSQIKKARAWNSERIMRRMYAGGRAVPAPAWFDAWILRTKYEQNDSGNWFGVEPRRYEPEGYVHADKSKPAPGTILSLPGGQDLYMMAREMHKDIQAGLLVTDDRALETGAPSATGYSDEEVPF